ncbi:hypothetical protein AV530_016977 [Patagioenas fasciata monilis]|uniref:Uncharacterized protein n=1 Tax=Patagioenas fasciata monilis TaxID=372326 RepID=A0A1V4J4S4_PATFA|nr:hypothetical protein AV530_016977 [Patagioenas fasciata monilis]
MEDPHQSREKSKRKSSRRKEKGMRMKHKRNFYTLIPNYCSVYHLTKGTDHNLCGEWRVARGDSFVYIFSLHRHREKEIYHGYILNKLVAVATFTKRTIIQNYLNLRGIAERSGS